MAWWDWGFMTDLKRYCHNNKAKYCRLMKNTNLWLIKARVRHNSSVYYIACEILHLFDSFHPSAWLSFVQIDLTIEQSFKVMKTV